MNSKFKVGDVVEATVGISRQDHRSHLDPGERATISQIWQTSEEDPQIVGVVIDGRLPMRDIVCRGNIPFRLVR